MDKSPTRTTDSEPEEHEPEDEGAVEEVDLAEPLPETLAERSVRVMVERTERDMEA